MKVQSLHLSIPTPCHEDWDKMIPIEKVQTTILVWPLGFILSPTLKIISLAKASMIMAILMLAIPAMSQMPAKAMEERSLEVSGISLVSHQPLEEKLRGIVVDEEGKPLVAANLMVKGGSRGTITNLKGQFNIELNRDMDTLIASYVGYESQLIIGYPKDKPDLQIVLKKGTYLDEIVVKAWKIALRDRMRGCGGIVENTIFPSNRVQARRKWDTLPEYEIKVYPNPFVSRIQIELGALKGGDYNLRLVASTGQIVYQLQLFLSPQQRIEMDLAPLSLPTGIYWLQISDGKDTNLKQQLIKVTP